MRRGSAPITSSVAAYIMLPHEFVQPLGLILSPFLGALLSLFKYIKYQFIIYDACKTSFHFVCCPIAQVGSLTVDVEINLIIHPEAAPQNIFCD